MDNVNFQDLQKQLFEVFTPSSPIKEGSSLAGRKSEIDALVETVHERGKHAVLFGERGAGKTSLALSLPSLISESSTVRVTSHAQSDYDELWRMLLRRVPFVQNKMTMGFLSKMEKEYFSLEQALPQNRKITTDDVIEVIETFGYQGIAIFDDFDCVVDDTTKAAMIETIKSLSDLGLPVTVIISGVGESVRNLIGQHTAIERVVRQVKISRMSFPELTEIIEVRLVAIGMTIDNTVKKRICHISLGFPHYAHLLTRSSASSALRNARLQIENDDMIAAFREIVRITGSNQDAYQRVVNVVQSAPPVSTMLLGSALAASEHHDGLFSVDTLLLKLKFLDQEESPDADTVSQLLQTLCSEEAGGIFEMSTNGEPRQFRFLNQMMIPFVIMQGVNRGSILPEYLESLKVYDAQANSDP